MESHSQYVLANATAAAGSVDRESPNSKCQGAKEQIEQEHTPPNFIHQSRSPTIHPTKIQKIHFSPKKIQNFKNKF